FHPRYDDLSNVQSGIENPEGYRFVEFPIYNAIFAGIYKVVPVFSLEAYGRLTTIVFSLILIAVIYYLLLKETSRFGAIVGSLTYAVFPFFVFFSRTVLPDTAAVSCAFISIYFLYRSIEKRHPFRDTVYFILAIVSFAAAVLIKPTAIFYGLTLLYIFVLSSGFSILKNWKMYVYFTLSFIPLIAWRNYITQYPQGIPSSDWLISSVNTYEGVRTIFLRPAFFRWIFFERINNIILGGYMTFMFILGLITRSKQYLIHSIFLSALIYLFVFEGGNVQHEYYQIIILPALAIAVGAGAHYLFTHGKTMIHAAFVTTLMISLFVISWFFSYYQVKNYYNYSYDYVRFATIISTLTHEDDKIVTDTLGDTTLLYLSNRRGAPSVFKDLTELKGEGYSYFFTQKSDVISDLKKDNKFKIVFENDKFALFKL
ncbi:glycosyltransferase family 39 protein, partial [Candidatus Roizmanbacteria bacterium]|nr:glycosyltransferase family 39 protein [Candidatus Roizmanbacteria bacterium]